MFSLQVWKKVGWLSGVYSDLTLRVPLLPLPPLFSLHLELLCLADISQGRLSSLAVEIAEFT